MTLEDHGPPGEDTPAPPALTRWSGEGVEEEGDLLPPYVPGSRGARPGSAAADEDDRTPIEAVAAAPTVEPEPAEPVENAYPFDMPSPELPQPGAATAPGEDAELGGGAPEAAAESGAGAPVAGPEGDEFPFHAFDLEGSAGAPAHTSRGPRGGDVEAAAAAHTGDAGVEAEALAGRLERLARALRQEGRPAVERELAADDRVTALLAGVLAGYLAREED